MNHLKGKLGGPSVIMLADNNTMIIKGRDAHTPPKFEHPTTLAAKNLETQAIIEQGLRDVC